MKQTATFFALLCLCGWVSAQHWQPLTANEHFHYQADTAHYISHVMLADSVTLDGTDSVFHLNRITAPCDTCVYYAGAILINQPQFLLRTATKHAGGLWEFRDGADGFVLHTQALAGESWPFHVGGSDTAVVVSADTATTFGTPDSVKRIAVGADTIVLSQQYGVLHFPAIGDSLAYTLTGIDHGRKVGENLPGLAEYYDFAPGDAFYFHYGWGECCPGWGWGYTQKRTILSKSLLGDTLVYTYSTPNMYGIDTADMKICEGNHESEYPLLSDFQSVKIPLPNVLIQKDVYPMYFGLKGNYGTVLRVNKRADGVISLSSGQGWDDNNLYFQFMETTLFGSSEGPLVMPAAMSYSLYMATGRGLLLQEISLFESGAAFRMIGYIKEGITYGTVPEDSVLIGVNQTVSPTFTLAPNPANTHVVLTLTGDARPGTATLLDLQGREIRQTAVTGGTAQLETADLPAGLYLLRVQTETGAATQKVVISH